MARTVQMQLPRMKVLRAASLLAAAIVLALGAAEVASGGRGRAFAGASIAREFQGRADPKARAERVLARIGIDIDDAEAGTGVVERLRQDHRRSIERALGVLDGRFDAWSDRVPAFADGLLSWSMRASLAWKGVRSALGSESAAAARMAIVRGRFEAEVMDGRALRDAIDETMERFALEIRADRSRALARVRSRVEWTAHGGGGVDLDAIGPFLQDTETRLDRSLLRQADRSIAGGVAGVMGAVIVTEVVVAGVGASIGGAAAGGAVAGATGGSIAPGVGTAIGLVAGLGAGIAVDWWMHARTREEVVNRCMAALEQLRREVLEGVPDARSSGLRGRLEEAAEREARAIEQAIRVATGGRP